MTAVLPTLELYAARRSSDGATAAFGFIVGGSIEELLTDFDRHLERQRGCTEGTRKHYPREARALLVRIFPDQEINWDNLTAGQIADFVSGRAQKLSLASRQNPAGAFRSL